MEKSIVKFDEDSGLDSVEGKSEMVGFSIIRNEAETRIRLEFLIKAKEFNAFLY